MVEELLAALFADAIEDESKWTRLRACSWLTAHPAQLSHSLVDDVLTTLSDALNEQERDRDQRQLLLESMDALLDGPFTDQVRSRVVEMLSSVISDWEGRRLTPRTTQFETAVAIAVMERSELFHTTK
jgi:hypothetical protein